MILFSQTREDPNVELSVTSENNHILLVGSGGCTVMSLINNNVVDVVDSNIEQIFLIKLKMHLANYADKYLDIICGKNISDDDINNILYNLPNDIKEYWNNNIDKIKFGINRCGVFEQLFRDLVKSNFNYDVLFDKKYLSSLFSNDAVKHTEEFKKHFSNVIKKYEDSYKPCDNYFYNQILYDCYNQDVPIYLNNLDNVVKYNNNVTFHNNTMTEYLLHNVDKKYDIIQISNLLDWMSHSDRKQLIMLCYNALNKNGFIIIRRLNGSYKLSDYLDEYFILHSNPQDKSHFYSEVAVYKKQ